MYASSKLTGQISPLILVGARRVKEAARWGQRGAGQEAALGLLSANIAEQLCPHPPLQTPPATIPILAITMARWAHRCARRLAEGAGTVIIRLMGADRRARPRRTGPGSLWAGGEDLVEPLQRILSEPIQDESLLPDP